jgi:lipopolysaccharide export system permease protein
MALPSPNPFRAVAAWWTKICHGLKKIPCLGVVLSLAGVIIWMVLTVKALLAMSAVANIGQQVEAVADQGKAIELAYRFFSQHWVLLAKCLAPALLVSFIRGRRGGLLLPLTLVGAWLYLWWLGEDLSSNLERAFHDPLGMVAAPFYYFLKLILMGFLIMSVPLLAGLYFNATILDQYLVRCFVFPFLLCLCAIAGIMITMDLLDNANDFVVAKFNFGKILLFYIAQLPSIFVNITEASLLLATLYALGRMSRYNELISMMSAGRSIARITAPILIFALWCSLAVMAFNYQMAPQSSQTNKEMLEEGAPRRVSRSAARVELNVAYRNREDRRNWLIWRLPYDLADKPIEEVWLMQQDPEGNPQTMIIAKRASWNPMMRTWTFFKATILDFKLGEALPVKRFMERYAIEQEWKETPGSILSERLNPEYLGVPELVSYLRTNAALPEHGLAKYESALHWRFALPFRCFLFVLLAAPLGIVSSRRGLLGGVTMAILLFMLVFFFSAVVLKAGEGLYVSPWVGAWLVNGIFLFLGLFNLWMRSSNRSWPGWNPLHWFRREATA